MRTVLINSPWAKDRLKNISDWWSLKFVFDEVIEIKESPTHQVIPNSYLTCLDMGFVNKHKHNFTLFVAPWEHPPKDKNGNTIPEKASCRGIYLPPLLPSLSRTEWWATRLFWNYPVIQVFANEHEIVQVHGKILGNAFEVWANHEFSHWLYSVIEKEDKTHDYFYSGEPERVREEIQKVLGKHG